MRVTPFVKDVKENEVFVFGSNEKGRHGKGAAKQALRWGAKYGIAEGLQGRTYALPTVNGSVTEALSLSKIKKYVDNLLIVIKNNPDKIFYITEIGCGLAGYSPKDIAPLFKNFIDLENVFLPSSFINIIKKN